MKIKSIKSNPFTVHTCSYIKASDLFKDCESAFTAFADSSPDCTWGDNDKTMIPPRLIQDSLKMMVGYSDDQCDKEIETLMERLDCIPNDVYIDLES